MVDKVSKVWSKVNRCWHLYEFGTLEKYTDDFKSSSLAICLRSLVKFSNTSVPLEISWKGSEFVRQIEKLFAELFDYRKEYLLLSKSIIDYFEHSTLAFRAFYRDRCNCDSESPLMQHKLSEIIENFLTQEHSKNFSKILYNMMKNSSNNWQKDDIFINIEMTINILFAVRVVFMESLNIAEQQSLHFKKKKNIICIDDLDELCDLVTKSS